MGKEATYVQEEGPERSLCIEAHLQIASHPSILSSLKKGLKPQRTVSPTVSQCRKQEASTPNLPTFPQVQFKPVTVFLAETRAGSWPGWNLFLESVDCTGTAEIAGYLRGGRGDL